MKIRVMSDLHIDVNTTYKFGFNDCLDEVDLNIIAGDIAGSYKTESTFLKSLNHKSPLVCVGGNHLGYDYNWEHNWEVTDNIGTKEYSIQVLQEITPPIYYLENTDILVNNKIVFGGTMYTDFNLYGTPEKSMRFGESGLNDFRLVKTYDTETDMIRNVNGTDYKRWFNAFITRLQERIDETAEDGLDIIVVTHFAPSTKSISEKYMSSNNSVLNPTYASNLEEFIKSNPRIKLWVHGHMHDSFDYMIGQCRVICYPYGYYGYEQCTPPIEYNGKIIDL